MLRDKDSPLSQFMTAELPDISAVRTSYRAKLPSGWKPTAVRPSPQPNVKPAWGMLGTAIDYRIQFALGDGDLHSGALFGGVMRCQEVAAEAAGFMRLIDANTRERGWLDQNGREAFPPTDLRHSVGMELIDHLDGLIQHNRPYDRSHSILLDSGAEDDLDRDLYAAAWYNTVYRTGLVALPGSPLEQPDRLTLKSLLGAVPSYALEDISAMVKLAEQGLDDLRRSGTPEDVVLAPVFSASALVGGADADVIASGLLLDVKADAKAYDIVERQTAHQLAGYVLLDSKDQFKITRVGWYAARIGSLASWEVDEFFKLLGATRTVQELRALLTETLRERLFARLRPRSRR